MVSSDSVEFSEFYQFLILLRDSDYYTKNLKILSNEVIRNSSKRDGNLRSLLIKLFTDLYLSDSKLDLAFDLIENLSAKMVMINDYSLQAYLCILKCLKLCQFVKINNFLLSKNPFLFKFALVKLKNLKSRNGLDIRIGSLLNLQKDMQKVISQHDCPDDILDFYCIFISLLIHNSSIKKVVWF